MRILFIVLLTGYFTNLWSQKFVAEFITNENGLSQNTIECLTQDASGFLWAGTSYGLNLYDSYDFNVFQNIPFDSTSLSCSRIEEVLIDQYDQVWVGNCLGLELFDRKNNEFKSFYFQNSKTNQLEKAPVNFLYEDEQGNIWIGSSLGLWIYRGGLVNNDNDLILTEMVLDLKLLNYAYVSKIFIEPQQDIWIGFYNRGVYRYEWDGKKLKAKNSYLADSSPLQFSRCSVNDIQRDKNGRIWFASSEGLFYYDEAADRMIYFEETGWIPFFSMCFEDDRQMLLGSRKGLIRLDYIEGVPSIEYNIFEDIAFNKKNKGLSFTKIIRDKIDTSTYWLATPNNGILRIKERENNFNPKNLTQYVSNASVNNLIYDDNYVWLDLPDTLLIHQLDNDSIFGLGVIRTENEWIDTKRINNIFKDSKGELWCATWEGILISLNGYLQEGKPAIVFQNEAIESFILSFFEEDGFLYLGTFGATIVVFDLVEKRFLDEQINVGAADNKFFYPVTSILRDRKNNLWVGTWQGLFLYENMPKPIYKHPDRKPIPFLHDDKNPESIPNHEIQKILEDTEGNVWVATSRGLLKFYYKNAVLDFKLYTEKDGLPNNHICTIELDSIQKDLWIGTRNGLSRFDYISDKVDNFFTKDGLQGKEFNIFSSYQNQDGVLFFGGTNGYNQFSTQKIKVEDAFIPIYLNTLITQDGKGINLNDRKEVQLNYDQNSFTIHFVGLNYNTTEGIEFVYELEGEELTRTSVKSSRQINFYKLPPGDYYLKVLSYKNGVPYGSGSDELQIIISAPVWLKPWFYVLVTAMIFAGILLFLNWRYRQRLEKIKMVENVRKNAAEDFHDELGSKLTVITLNSRMLENEITSKNSSIKEYVQKITSTSSTLIESMRDMLWTLNPEHDSLIDLYEHLQEFGLQLFESGEIEFHSTLQNLNTKQQSLAVDVQRHVLLIFKEAMNNSLKHADCKNVFFEIKFKEDNLYLELQDDGKGFPLKNIQSGYGLNNMKSRAKKINAILNVNSSSNGTLIQLII